METGKVLKAEEILRCDDLHTELVECKEWGGSVKIRPLTMQDRQEIHFGSMSSEGQSEPSKFNVLCFIKGVMEPIFKASDYEALSKKNGKVIMDVLDRIWAISGMGNRSEIKKA